MLNSFLSSCLRRPARIVGALLSFLALAGCQLWPSKIYNRLDLGPGTPQIRVLMIGDSLTYYHDLPGLLQQFSVAEKSPIHIEQITTAYTSLSYHWSHGAADTIRQGHFDFVILQDFSRKPATDPDECISDYAKYDKEIKQDGGGGGKTIVFQNWTLSGHQDDYPAMLKTYATIVQQTGATLAPIGTAWKTCAAERPDIRLLADDRHPTDAGTYLAACVLYDVIYRKKSADLPTSLAGPNLPPSTLSALRIIADRAVYSPVP